MPAGQVEVCDFFIYTSGGFERLLQRAAAEPQDGSVPGYDIQVGEVIPVPAMAEVDVVEEVQVVTIND